jgi:predicted RNase H-like HicB family nuclease
VSEDLPQIPHEVFGIVAKQGETIDETTAMRNIEELLQQMSGDANKFRVSPSS